MSCRQHHPADSYSVCCEVMGQMFCCMLAALVLICIEGEIDGALAVAQLTELCGVEMRAQRAGDVGETCLTQGGIVEQTFDQDDLRVVANLLPCI